MRYYWGNKAERGWRSGKTEWRNQRGWANDIIKVSILIRLQCKRSVRWRVRVRVGEWVSGASKQVNRRAIGLVLTSRFLAVLNHRVKGAVWEGPMIDVVWNWFWQLRTEIVVAKGETPSAESRQPIANACQTRFKSLYALPPNPALLLAWIRLIDLKTDYSSARSLICSYVCSFCLSVLTVFQVSVCRA